MPPLLMLISSAMLRSALQVIVINQLPCDQALPSTAASSQPALLSVNGTVFPPQLWLSYIKLRQRLAILHYFLGLPVLGLSVCPLGLLFTLTYSISLTSDRPNQGEIMGE